MKETTVTINIKAEPHLLIFPLEGNIIIGARKERFLLDISDMLRLIPDSMMNIVKIDIVK